MNRTANFYAPGLAVLFIGITALGAHDEGHEVPDQLPPIGPHGGKYGKMERHFAEITVQGDTVTVYILEPDVKHVAEDATGVTAALSRRFTAIRSYERPSAETEWRCRRDQKRVLRDRADPGERPGSPACAPRGE